MLREVGIIFKRIDIVKIKSFVRILLSYKLYNS